MSLIYNFSLLFYSMHFTFIIIYPLKTKLIKVFKNFQTLKIFLFISNIITLYTNSLVFVKNFTMVLYIVNIYKCFLYNFITDLEKLYILKLLVMCVLVAQLCRTLSDTMDWSLPGSSIQGILQARILEWIAISLPRESSRLQDWTLVSCIAGRFYHLSNQESP